MRSIQTMLKTILQAVLAFFRIFGLDLYKAGTASCIRQRLRAARPKGVPLRTDGVGLMLNIPFSISLAQVGRDFIDKLSKTTIPFCVLDTNIPQTYQASLPDEEVAHYRKFTGGPFDQNAVIQFTTSAPISDRSFSMAMTPFWEFQSGMMEVEPHFFEGFHHAIVFSDFCHAYFKKAAPKDVAVHCIRYPFPMEKHVVDRSAARSKFGIPQDAFVAFYNFDLRSCIERKNPLAAIEAFAKAFPVEPNTMIVFKISGQELHPDRKQRLMDKAQAVGLNDRLRLVSEYLSREEIFQLTGSADVYLSLHRGEGLGLGMLEAMSVGVPVIATAYGGNMDFTKETTAFLVPFTMVKPETDFGMYARVVEWPDPVLEVASRYLRDLYEHPEVGRAKAKTAQTFIENYYSLESFEKEFRRLISDWNLQSTGTVL